jgi:DNA-binding NtrC family response regulator
MATILVIDDSESVLALTADYLRTAGHTVLTTSSGRDGFVILEEYPVDLVLTDIYMPEPDGLEILTKAREKKLRVPFIAMSSQEGDANFFKLAKALGAVTTIQKPFTAPQLNTVVDGVLRHRKRNTAMAMPTTSMPPASRNIAQRPRPAAPATQPFTDSRIKK